MSRQVTLTLTEMMMAASVGALRQITAVLAGRPDKHGYDGAGWNIHIEGACGEAAAAKALDMYWSGSVNTFKRGGDVGRLQVRTRSKLDYELIVRDGDKDEDIFVLVVGTAPTFSVIGRILGRDAKRPEWRKTHGGRSPAFFVPHTALEAVT